MTKKFPKLKSKAVLAPMIGFTNAAFRALAKKYGACLTYTGLISSAALAKNKEELLHNSSKSCNGNNNIPYTFHYKNKEIARILRTEIKVSPVACQLFGSDAENIAKAAAIVEDCFDIIDINCGCPAVNVTKLGAGSALMKKPEKIADIVRQAIESVNIPVTVKIRAGISPSKLNAIETAKMIEEAGAAAIAVHGRARNQGYKTPADWNVIREIKEALDIPVIGNGDIATPEQFKQRLDESNVDYIMIGRAGMKNPYLFRQINDYLKTGEYKHKDKLSIIADYMKLAEKYNISYDLVKNNVIQMTKGIEQGAALRKLLSTCKTLENLKKLIDL
ncbi:MAG: tRNA-dihydrouridine synthase [Candidatus Aenigmarchaeota archaeon]|nr:tRNA-dihydrouridine synthase [Candidatus Aenigmarchaeota archaeon]